MSKIILTGIGNTKITSTYLDRYSPNKSGFNSYWRPLLIKLLIDTIWIYDCVFEAQLFCAE